MTSNRPPYLADQINISLNPICHTPAGSQNISLKRGVFGRIWTYPLRLPWSNLIRGYLILVNPSGSGSFNSDTSSTNSQQLDFWSLGLLGPADTGDLNTKSEP